ncbi:uncharacterized protein LOC134536810 isoform X15 [Bacillus rossius redtenbacheri]|uniref:uncharacterized protein LOC134536810 isoform X15 n=1 Tax=Bacillus rossius redtenbacheri TaxID=93214 RepID=UPI002FDDDD29
MSFRPHSLSSGWLSLSSSQPTTEKRLCRAASIEKPFGHSGGLLGGVLSPDHCYGHEGYHWSCGEELRAVSSAQRGSLPAVASRRGRECAGFMCAVSGHGGGLLGGVLPPDHCYGHEGYHWSCGEELRAVSSAQRGSLPAVASRRGRECAGFMCAVSGHGCGLLGGVLPPDHCYGHEGYHWSCGEELRAVSSAQRGSLPAVASRRGRECAGFMCAVSGHGGGLLGGVLPPDHCYGHEGYHWSCGEELRAVSSAQRGSLPAVASRRGRECAGFMCAVSGHGCGLLGGVLPPNHCYGHEGYHWSCGEELRAVSSAQRGSPPAVASRRGRECAGFMCAVSGHGGGLLGGVLPPDHCYGHEGYHWSCGEELRAVSSAQRGSLPAVASRRGRHGCGLLGGVLPPDHCYGHEGYHWSCGEELRAVSSAQRGSLPAVASRRGRECAGFMCAVSGHGCGLLGGVLPPDHCYGHEGYHWSCGEELRAVSSAQRGSLPAVASRRGRECAGFVCAVSGHGCGLLGGVLPPDHCYGHEGYHWSCGEELRAVSSAQRGSLPAVASRRGRECAGFMCAVSGHGGGLLGGVLPPDHCYGHEGYHWSCGEELRAVSSAQRGSLPAVASRRGRECAGFMCAVSGHGGGLLGGVLPPDHCYGHEGYHWSFGEELRAVSSAQRGSLPAVASRRGRECAGFMCAVSGHGCGLLGGVLPPDHCYGHEGYHWSCGEELRAVSSAQRGSPPAVASRRGHLLFVTLPVCVLGDYIPGKVEVDFNHWLPQTTRVAPCIQGLIPTNFALAPHDYSSFH